MQENSQKWYVDIRMLIDCDAGNREEALKVGQKIVEAATSGKPEHAANMRACRRKSEEIRPGDEVFLTTYPKKVPTVIVRKVDEDAGERFATVSLGPELTLPADHLVNVEYG